MRTLALKRTVKRLAALAGSSGPCPACADWLRPVLLRGDAPEPPCCPACGRRPFVVRLIYDPDFFGNRRRLDEVNHAAAQPKEM
jgi:hypothetical protein